jgi:DNA (cytosine-5)-methyltransferase 1
MWAPRTSANACSSSPNLPTPRASEGEKGGPNQRGSKGDLTLSAVTAQLPTPRARDWKGADPNPRGADLNHAVTTLPTPTVGDSRNSRNATANRKNPKPTTHVGALTLSDVAYLMPTPRTSDATGSGQHGEGGPDLRTAIAGLAGGDQGEQADTGACGCGRAPWGKFAPAIHRWEAVTGRAAPPPVNDRGRLDPVFVEWLMGLGAGHVTAVPGLSRTAQLKALGNGVVPQQAAAALRYLLDRAAEDDQSAEHDRAAA